MLRLLQHSTIDPVSYAGLAYCGRDQCGRVGCSEVCWFGTARRQAAEIHAIRALVQQHEGPVHKLRVWKPHWGCLSGQLHSLKLTQAKAILARILRERCDFRTTAAGMVKVLPFSLHDRRWLLEVHCVVVGSDEGRLKDAFSVLKETGSFTLSKVEDLERTLFEVSGREIRRYISVDCPPESEDLLELYSWLSQLPVGARMFRFGCNKNFEFIYYRTIKGPPIKQVRRRRRRRRRRVFSRPVRPYPMPDDRDYYDDRTQQWKTRGRTANGLAHH
jgi:hypothetical protein